MVKLCVQSSISQNCIDLQLVAQIPHGEYPRFAAQFPRGEDFIAVERNQGERIVHEIYRVSPTHALQYVEFYELFRNVNYWNSLEVLSLNVGVSSFIPNVQDSGGLRSITWFAGAREVYDFRQEEGLFRYLGPLDGVRAFYRILDQSQREYSRQTCMASRSEATRSICLETNGSQPAIEFENFTEASHPQRRLLAEVASTLGWSIFEALNLPVFYSASLDRSPDLLAFTSMETGYYIAIGNLFLEQYPEVQRLTFAHELGHCIYSFQGPSLVHHLVYSLGTYVDDGSAESEAYLRSFRRSLMGGDERSLEESVDDEIFADAIAFEYANARRFEYPDRPTFELAQEEFRQHLRLRVEVLNGYPSTIGNYVLNKLIDRIDTCPFLSRETKIQVFQLIRDKLNPSLYRVFDQKLLLLGIRLDENY